MGIMVSKDDNSELSRRISSDLRSRTRTEAPGDVAYDDNNYTKDLKKTSKFGWIWIVLIVLAILSLIAIKFI